jgi:hypothetical protein
VMVYPEDPVANGIVASLARPGGNVTGVTYFAGQLSQKGTTPINRGWRA